MDRPSVGATDAPALDRAASDSDRHHIGHLVECYILVHRLTRARLQVDGLYDSTVVTRFPVAGGRRARYARAADRRHEETASSTG